VTAKLPFGGKAVLTKPKRPDLSSFIYPPYTERAFNLTWAKLVRIVAVDLGQSFGEVVG
jgi:hypothetical protein